METRRDTGARRRASAGAALAGCALIALFATSASATAAEPEIRWMPWLGCWQPALPDGLVPAGEAGDILCVVPTRTGVEIHTVTDGRSVSTLPLTADGAAATVRQSGCEGWRSAEWSVDGRRLFLRSEMDCEGDARRITTGIMAMADGEWIDVQVVEVAGQAATRARRYRPVDPPAAFADIFARLEDQRLARETARQAAGVRMSPDDVVEAVHKAGPAATSVLLVERGDAFRLDRRTLLALDEAGVPGDVIDLMVALAYPDVFEIDPVAAAADFRPDEPWAGEPRRPGYDPMRRPGRIGSGLCPGLYDPFGMYDFFGRPLYGYWGSPRSSWRSLGACAPLGWGRYYGGGWFSGPVVPIVIVRPGQTDTGARAVQGRGYTRGARAADDESSGRLPRATPREPRPTTSASPPSTGGTRVTPRGTRSSDDRSGGRRAQPRGGGGSDDNR